MRLFGVRAAGQISASVDGDTGRQRDIRIGIRTHLDLRWQFRSGYTAQGLHGAFPLERREPWFGGEQAK